MNSIPLVVSVRINDLLCLELGRLAAGRRGGCAQDLASPPIIQY